MPPQLSGGFRGDPLQATNQAKNVETNTLFDIVQSILFVCLLKGWIWPYAVVEGTPFWAWLSYEG